MGAGCFSRFRKGVSSFTGIQVYKWSLKVRFLSSKCPNTVTECLGRVIGELILGSGCFLSEGYFLFPLTETE